LHLEPDFKYSSLNFFSYSWRRITTNKIAINWQNFAQVGLKLKLEYGGKSVMHAYAG